MSFVCPYTQRNSEYETTPSLSSLFILWGVVLSPTNTSSVFPSSPPDLAIYPRPSSGTFHAHSPLTSSSPLGSRQPTSRRTSPVVLAVRVVRGPHPSSARDLSLSVGLTTLRCTHLPRLGWGGGRIGSSETDEETHSGNLPNPPYKIS